MDWGQGGGRIGDDNGIFFFKQKTAYEMLRSLVGSEMCIRDRCTLVIGKKQEIIHEAQVGRAAQLTRHEMIELVEIAVCPKLTGQVADGQAARAVDGKQVVVREVDHVILSSQRAGAAAQNQRDQAAQVAVLDAPVEGVLQLSLIHI